MANSKNNRFRNRVVELLREKRRKYLKDIVGISAARRMGVTLPVGVSEENVESLMVVFKPNEEPKVVIVYKADKKGIRPTTEEFGLVPLQDLVEAEVTAQEEETQNSEILGC